MTFEEFGKIIRADETVHDASLPLRSGDTTQLALFSRATICATLLLAADLVKREGAPDAAQTLRDIVEKGDNGVKCECTNPQCKPAEKPFVDTYRFRRKGSVPTWTVAATNDDDAMSKLGCKRSELQILQNGVWIWVI